MKQVYTDALINAYFPTVCVCSTCSIYLIHVDVCIPKNKFNAVLYYFYILDIFRILQTFN